MKTKALSALALLFVSAALAADQPLLFPQGFRGWATVKTAIVTSAHPMFQSEGGMHHIYANDKGVQGYTDGQFADGSVLVYELLETQEKNGVISEGPLRRVDIMVKDSARYASTGGWGFERFMGADHTPTATTELRTTCFQCHNRVANHGLVFSHIR